MSALVDTGAPFAPVSTDAALWTAFWAAFHQVLDGSSAYAVVRGRPEGKAGGKPQLNPGTAMAFAAEAWGLSVAHLISPIRDVRTCDARSLAVWALREVGAPWSYPAIGRAMGGRDHSTIINLRRRADRLIKDSPRFAGACEDLLEFFQEQALTTEKMP